MKDRKSCVIYDSWAEMIVNMPDDTAGQLIKNMMRYVFDKGETEFTSPEVQAMFCMIKEKLDVDSEKYQAKVNRAQSLNQNRNEIDTKSTRNSNDNASVSVSVSDNVSVYPTDIKDKKERRGKPFTAPSVEEVKDYCQERGNGVDPETFVDFYASKGWKVGNTTMKDWKAAVRTWEKRDNKSRAAPEPYSATSYLLNKIAEGGFK